MSANDFYFAVNAMFRHLHDRHGHGVLVEYWRRLGREYYADRASAWRAGGAAAVAADWSEYFGKESGAVVAVARPDERSVELDVRTCPAIKHLRDHGRDIVPYFCEHCDYICGATAEAAGFTFERVGGMGSCRQRFVQLNVARGARTASDDNGSRDGQTPAGDSEAT
jgi:hypothetical protein